MTTKDDGNYAFPVNSELHGTNYSHGGMTLRDYFADSAMQSLLAVCEASRNGLLYSPETIANNSYAMADAMLAARGAA